MGKHTSSAFAPGDFDVWMLAQSWAPHFCCHHADRCLTAPFSLSATHLSLHGLWPGFKEPRSGGQTFPASCEKAQALFPAFLPREYIDLAPSFTTYNAAERRADVGKLAIHEYKKHGTCSGLSPSSYFAEALRAFGKLPGDRGTPQLLSQNVGGSVATNALRSAYAAKVALKADKLCRLTEVTSCFAVNADGTVGELIDCPAHTMQSRDVGERCASLRITQLGQCLANDGQHRKKK